MRRRMTVVCQDASGRREEICVQADTDEKACDAALAILNTWRAVRVIATTSIRAEAAHRQQENPVSLAASPETGGGGNERGVRAPVPSSPPRGPKIIREATALDWINPNKRTDTTVGRALLAAARKAA